MLNHVRVIRKNKVLLFIAAWHNLILHKVFVRYFLKNRWKYEKSLLSYGELKRDTQLFYYLSEMSLLSYYKHIYQLCTQK